MDIRGFAADHFGHFSPYDIANLLFAMVAATFLGYAMARWGGGKRGQELRALAVWAGLAALGVGFVRAQLPLAVAFLALVLLAKGNEASKHDRLLLFASLVLGVGCGSGATLVTIVLTLPFLLIVRWAFGPAVKD